MNSRLKILVVDDEVHIRRLIAVALKRDGYEPVEAATAKEALSFFEIVHPAAVLIDLGLPDRDGLELVTKFAATKSIAILVVSARESTDDKIAALDLGADDYVTKPFDSDELLARLRAALRRQTATVEGETNIRTGSLDIDLGARIVRRAGAEVRLTPKEYAFLTELARSAGRVVTHTQILRSVWGAAHDRDVEYLRVTARALRLKLEDDPARPAIIRNEPGIGYRLILS